MKEFLLRWCVVSVTAVLALLCVVVGIGVPIVAFITGHDIIGTIVAFLELTLTVTLVEEG